MCLNFAEKWAAFGRRFYHGDSDTNVPIENVWKLLKYLFLEKKVNVRAGVLLDRLVGMPDDTTSVAASVVDYYRRRVQEHILYLFVLHYSVILNKSIIYMW